MLGIGSEEFVLVCVLTALIRNRAHSINVGIGRKSYGENSLVTADGADDTDN